MIAIVCVDKNWGIGKDGDMLFHISADLRRFRELTIGKSVVMGKNTLLSLPGAKPLPKRRNIVVSTTLPSSNRATSSTPVTTSRSRCSKISW